MALLVAACFLIARVLRLGWLADYLSRPVLVGYIHGVAIVLIVGQLEKLTGIDVDAGDPVPQLVELGREIGDVSASTFAVGAVALLLLIPARYVAPRPPAALIVVIGAIVASKALGLDEHGVAVVGDIPAGLPERVPSPPWEDVVALAPAAAGLFLVSFADEVLTARSFAGRHGQHIRADQELLAMGAANAAAGVTQGFPVGRAARAPPSTTAWGRAARSPACSPPQPSCWSCCSSPRRSPPCRRRCSARSSSPPRSA
jgi:MFS superfamily sulfate permease-like transporter